MASRIGILYVLPLLFALCSTLEDTELPLVQIQTSLQHLGDLEGLDAPEISETCHNHLLAYEERIQNVLGSVVDPGDQWALKMFDAHSRWPDGILEGNLFTIGTYFSCLEVDVSSTTLNNTQLDGFKGRYLSAFFTHIANGNSTKTLQPEDITKYELDQRNIIISGPPLNNDPRYVVPLFFRLGLCVPSSCSVKEISGLVLAKLEAFNTDTMQWGGLFAVDVSDADETSLDAFDIAMISILVIFGALAGLGLLADLFWTSNTKPVPLLKEFLIGFSPYTNSRKLLNTSSPASSATDHLNCINGIRFLSMSWVLLSHSFGPFQLQAPVMNIVRINQYFGNFWSQVLLNGYPSVDSFFFLGGCLLAYMTFKELDRAKGKLNILMFYVHRYIRLTGVYAVVLLFRVSFQKYLAVGPNNSFDFGVRTCRETVWRNLLYINNFNSYDLSSQNGQSYPYCAGPSWYLATEMQMFIVSPLIFYPMWLAKNKLDKAKWHLEYVWLGLLIAVFTATIMILTAIKGWGATPFLDNSSTYFLENYYKPWCRIQPYLAGIGLGYLLHLQRGKAVKLDRIYVMSGWVLATATALAVLYGADIGGVFMLDVSQYTSEAKNIAYGGFHRLAWGLSMAWMVWACVKGYGGFVNKFLSWEAFAPLARLSYVMYLIHDMVIGVLAAFLTFPLNYMHIMTVIAILWVLMVTILFSLSVVVLFEMPLLQCEKLLFGKILRFGHGNAKKKDNVKT